ncbi:50S ribosomal protein L11 [Rickettsia endosymbiont of Cardiosporidium cionae]|uniref:50S ribosomal protein L11 n=1 Tax=Rickettsia endosymbiont of Cardiosporidium cionae TaxID=2777155 RepID=UPI0018930796|nr:50S ribosomal protein L11 [Rickettsia endosymbiont of Cardiosporidium cionae]KAF8818627.1 50S ribosomal protein L11 [Rickettsia endosymbiont of Cardiosporidium cionae]
MKSQKKVSGYIKLTVPAGNAKAGPPIGPALGQRGVNIMSFCKLFNEATSKMDENTPVPVVITVYLDKTFDFITKTPPVSFYLKKYTNITKGSAATKKLDYIANLSKQDCLEIAKIKLQDLNAYDIEAAAKIVEGSADSMGIKILQ